MSIKYELSLWREFPGANEIQEEKVCILAATDMCNSGRAQDIKLKKEYNGKQTLTFDIPVKYQDIITGQDTPNPFIEQVIDHSKLKLWRDERWWNPFATNKGVDEKTGCTIFEGAWVQGKWYEFIVTDRKQKRSKKKLLYSYSCDSLFMNELSRTGYNLEFVPDTDIMSANGMGTAHDLAKRIVEGTDWQYIKTEVFPDYKEEYNAITGETIKTPVSTDQIEFASGLERYLYCYNLKISDSRIEELTQEIISLGMENKISLVKDVDFGFDEDNTFWWKPKANDDKKHYIYGYNKTDVITSYADKVLCYTDGLIEKGACEVDEDLNVTLLDEKVAETTLLSSTNLWEPLNGATIDVTLTNNGETSANYTLDVKNITSFKPILCNSGYSDTTLEKGQHLIVNMSAETYTSAGTLNTNSDLLVLYIYDGNPINNPNLTPIKYYLNGIGNTDYCFKNSYIITLSKRITNPYFALGYNNATINGGKAIIRGLFIYKFVGATDKWDKSIKSWIGSQPTYSNLIKDFDSENYWPDDVDKDKTLALTATVDSYTLNCFDLNLCVLTDGSISPIWVPVGTMAQNDFKNGIDVYCMEFNRDGKYYDIYPTLKESELTKISSYNTDKRRAISGSKSNRYSLLETVSKTFFCFTRFIVEHTDNGYIKTDTAGRPLKYFTYVSELGRRNFNGFNYGVNLEGVERKIDSKSLVTKVYVEPIDNQYTNSGTITIQNSDYNKMGESFFYNFSYFARQGFFDNSKFMKDYVETYDYVGLKNAQAKDANEKYISKEQYRQTKNTAYETHNLLLSSYVKQANETLDYIKWTRFVEKVKSMAYFNYSEEYVTFPTINWEWISSIRAIAAGEGETPYEKIAYYMSNIRYDQYQGFDGAEAWVGNGTDENDIATQLESVGVAQTEYINLKATVDSEFKELTEISTKVEELLKEYNNYIAQKNKKLNWFEKKYRRFILEGTWSGNDYIDPDVYYLDATRAMSTSCMPKVSYSMNVIDLSKVANPYNPEDTEWGMDFTFDVGDTTYIRDVELFGNIEQKSMIADIVSYVDVNKPDDITLTNFETRFEELFQSIAAAVTTIQLNENIYSRAENFTPEGTIDVSILQKSFNENKNLVISSSNNKVTQDQFGITIKTDDNSGELLRAIASGIFISKDNGKTFTAGLTANGMNANLITTGQLDTSKVVIRSGETPQYVLDTLGLTAYSVNAETRQGLVRDSSFVRFDQFGVYATDKGRLFGRNWWKEQYKYETKPHEVFCMEGNTFYSDVNILRKGETVWEPQFEVSYAEIDANFTDWQAAIYVNTADKVKEIVDIYYYRKEAIYDGDREHWGTEMDWFPGSTWGMGFDIREVIKNESFITSDGNYFIVFFDIDKYNTLDALWSGRVKVKYVDRYIDISYNDSESYIEEHSIFSLTRKGLLINSGAQSNETYKGWVRISTKVPNIEIYSYNDETDTLYKRVKLGYLKTNGETGEHIHGLDIYDGCIAIYNKAYTDEETPNNDDKVLYFDEGKLIVKGQIEADSGSIGGWKISSSRIYATTDLLDFRISSTPDASNSYFTLYDKTRQKPMIQVSYQSAGDCIFRFGSYYEKYYYNNYLDGADIYIGPDPTNTTSLTALLRLRYEKYDAGGYVRIYNSRNSNRLMLYGTASEGSDVRLKQNIQYKLDLYEQFYDSLKPCSFNYTDMPEKNKFGFIAQDVVKAYEKIQVDSQDYDMISLDELGYYSLIYTQFVSLNTWQIQKAKARITELEDKVNKLETQLKSLTNF